MAGFIVRVTGIGPKLLLIGAALFAALGVALIIVGIAVPSTLWLIVGIVVLVGAAFLAYDAYVDLQSKRGQAAAS